MQWRGRWGDKGRQPPSPKKNNNKMKDFTLSASHRSSYYRQNFFKRIDHEIDFLLLIGYHKNLTWLDIGTRSKYKSATK